MLFRLAEALPNLPVLGHTSGPLPTSWPRWVRPAAPQIVADKRELLAPAAFTRRRGEWQPVSILDSAASAPLIPVEPVRRRYQLVPAWQEGALCAGTAPHSDALFFGVDDEDRPALAPTATAEARSYCTRCPIRRDCLTWALTEDERFGIWGGVTGRQRMFIRQRMARDPLLTIAEIVDEFAPA